MVGRQAETLSCVDNLEKLCFEAEQRKRGEKPRPLESRKDHFLMMGDSSAYLYASGCGLVEQKERELEGGSPPSFDKYPVIPLCQAPLWGHILEQDGPDQAATPASVHPGGCAGTELAADRSKTGLDVGTLVGSEVQRELSLPLVASIFSAKCEAGHQLTLVCGGGVTREMRGERRSRSLRRERKLPVEMDGMGQLTGAHGRFMVLNL